MDSLGQFDGRCSANAAHHERNIGPHRGRAYYYGDDTNLEADAILEGLDGQWAAVEIKMGGASAITEAMQSLRAVRARVDTARRGEPARLIVITAFGPGYQTDDGIAVVPLTALRP